MTGNRFFAAANTGVGFLSRFHEIFDPKKHDEIYIIKGGAGTGKSTFMKRLGEEAERRGFLPEYYYCSSDIHSLDGLVIREIDVCVLDGTAPHVTEARYPGAVETVLDFGAAFDVSALKRERAKITALSENVSERYSRAYAALRAAHMTMAERLRVCRSFYLSEKAEAAAGRLLSGMSRGKTDAVGICTFCGEGRVRLPVFFDAAKKTVAVGDFYGIESLFLADIERVALARGISAKISRDPVCPDMAESVYFDKDGVYIASSAEESDKSVNPRRFADVGALKDERGYLRLLKKLETGAKECAVSSLKQAADVHKELEEIYIEHTDFSVIDGIFEKTKRKIFEKG